MTLRSQKDIFCFYNLQTEIPKTFFTKLGDSKIVTHEAVRAITQFIKENWQVLVSLASYLFLIDNFVSFTTEG